MTHPWETPDPDAIEDSLKTLSFFTDSLADSVWHHLMDMDPDEILAARDKMKMELARYGKQSLLQWDDVEVSVIRRWHSVLAEIVKGEQPAQSGTED